jgi:hypothetical protein
VTTTFIASQRLGKPLLSQQRESKIVNCSTKCSLVGARRTTSRGLLEDCRRVKGDSPASEVRIRLRDSPVKKTDTAY